jgi:hypothetical protein
LRVVPKPQRFVELEKERNESATGEPALKILFPTDGATISGATVPCRISLNDNPKLPAANDDLIALTLDNEPYVAGHSNKLSPQAAPELGPVELRNVAQGSHLLRAFILKPSLETYKNINAFRMITFIVAGNGDEAKHPVSKKAIGKDAGARLPAGGGLAVDPSKPLLTFALPNGLEVRTDAAVVIDFYLSNAMLKGNGGEFRVRYTIDDDDPQWINQWEPVWLAGWIEGKHTIRLELVGPGGWPFPNGGYNIITREISVVNH